MQYLIDELIDRAKTDDMISLKLVIGLAVVRLEKEKDQIINSYSDGRLSVITKEIISYQDYYDSNFGHKVEEAGI